MKNYFLFIFATIIAVSCSNKEIEADRSFQKININNSSTKDTVELDSFLTFKRLIKLDTSVKAIISRINKIRAFNGKLYIYDMMRKGLKIFDNTGRFLSSFYREGEAPGEYLFLADFDIHPVTGDLYVLDSQRRLLLIYDSSLTYKNKILLPVYALNFQFINPDVCALYTGTMYDDLNINKDTKTACRLFIINLKDNKAGVVAKALNFPADGREYANDGVFSNFFASNSNICFAEAYNNLVYEITPDTILPKYELVFALNNLPADSFLNFKNLGDVRKIQNSYCFYKFHLMETDRYISGVCWQNGDFIFIYDKHTKKSWCTKSITVDGKILEWAPNDGLYSWKKKSILMEIPQQQKHLWDKNILPDATEENPWLAEFEIQ